MSYFSGTVGALSQNPTWQIEKDVDWDSSDESAIEKTMSDAIDDMLKTDPSKMHIKSREGKFTVGHRIVHGGPKYSQSIRVTDEVLKDLEQLNDFAPLHNPINLRALKLARKLMPNATHVAAFDTAFHSTIAAEAAIYPGPYEWYENQQIKRYGFHGLSHKYSASFAMNEFTKISSRAEGASVSSSISRAEAGSSNNSSEEAASSSSSREKAASKIAISCHLGGGCSLAALQNGKSLDTTMGFTPLEGLMMRSRSGSIDPGLIIYFLKNKTYSVEELDKVLNKESGLKGIFEKSGDMREIEKAMNAGDARAKLAFDMFVNSIVSNIGALATKYGGLNMLIFTGGIGAHSRAVRTAVCNRLSILGVRLDDKLDAEQISDDGGANCGSTDSKGVAIFHFVAKEDYQIALDCVELSAE